MQKIELTKNSLVVSSLQLQDTEVISGTTFEQLLADKPCIVLASVMTRDRRDFRKKYIHCYYGPNLIKILFSTFQLPNQQVLRSRYNTDFPITAKDPLTNEVIVGEVLFFLLKQGQVEATCFGSDFNYATSREFRDLFKEYVDEDFKLIDVGLQEQSSEQGAQFESVVPIHWSDKKSYNNLMVYLQRQANLGFHLPSKLRVCLTARAKAFDFFGTCEGLFFMCAVMTVYRGIRLLFEDDEIIDVFVFVLPLIGLLTNLAIMRLFDQKPSQLALICSLALSIYYIIVAIADLRMVAIINMIVVPIIMIVYQILLI